MIKKEQFSMNLLIIVQKQPTKKIVYQPPPLPTPVPYPPHPNISYTKLNQAEDKLSCPEDTSFKKGQVWLHLYVKIHFMNKECTLGSQEGL